MADTEAWKTVDLEALADKYELLDIKDDLVIVAEKALREPTTSELGYSATSTWSSVYREEYNPKLRDLSGAQKYDEMKRNDGQVRASLRIIKTPILAGRWYMDPVSNSPGDQKIADELSNNLFRSQTASWPRTLWESLFCIDYGWYSFEKVFEYDDTTNKLQWRKFAPRHPLDALRWEWDENGGPKQIVFNGNDAIEVPIPIDKLLVFTLDQEGGDLRGLSILRSAYKHWFYKEQLYKIDAIQKERHGIGIPVIKLPMGFNDVDKAKANELGRSLRTNEKAHITLPPNWEIMMLKLEGQPVDCLKSIEHHNRMIIRNILADFVMEADSSGGAQILEELFVKSTRYIADSVRDVWNKWAIPELVRWNYGENVQPPELKVRRIGETTDWRTWSFALRNLIGAQALEVDTPLQEWIREEMDMPKFDPESVVETESPQLPRVGMPRQSTARKQEIGPAKGDRTQDRSGG